jgi:hypothetical protein
MEVEFFARRIYSSERYSSHWFDRNTTTFRKIENCRARDPVPGTRDTRDARFENTKLQNTSFSR